MATMTQQTTSFADSRHSFTTTAAVVTLFWIIAAIGVGAVHLEIDPRSSSGGAVASIAIIVIAAWSYMRFCARWAGISHALGVGIAWLVLGIAAEIGVTMRVGHGWYAVLGTPDHPLLRNIYLFVWIFAPAIFAQREVDE
ncbi:MAG TPA: hypothetical protein VHW00_06650 [Thermoanaerobaculia bacterium]|nr:hypothetical protein [Thermoanaerobaculia bacterium]